MAGSNYTSSESSNILIGYEVNGTVGESNVLRIGNATGSGNGNLAASYIQGIAGVTVSNSSAVLINTTTGQLGTIASSQRYKENIQDMADTSSPIMNMRPVTFNYIKEESKVTHWGLIAEEVMQILPELVNKDKEGNADSIQYHEMTCMLLNEIQKLAKRIEILEKK